MLAKKVKTVSEINFNQEIINQNSGKKITVMLRQAYSGQWA